MTNPLSLIPPKGLKIAVIGAGVAGLTAAHLLGPRHAVTLYERNAYLGGHTNTLTIDRGPDQGTPVDTGFIVYNDRNYPTFIRLLADLGVESRPSDMSFSFSSRKHDLEYSSYVPGGLFAQCRNILNPVFYGMLADILRFNRTAVRDLLAGRLSGQTLGEYLTLGHFNKPFIDFYLTPMGAAIWSTPLKEMFDFPARSFIRFFYNHGLLALKGRPHWRTIPGGAQTYVRAIEKRFSGKVILNARLAAVSRTAESVTVREKNGAMQTFDYVIFAAHADEVLPLLTDPSADEKRLLGAWEYTPNTAVLHSDVSAMPRNQRAWASWNYLLEGESGPATPVSLTYHMNRLQNLKTRLPYFVTLNRKAPLAEERIYKVIHYMHPKYTLKSLGSQAGLPALNGKNRTFFCGSYFGYGFHEDAVKSAVDAVSVFGVTL